MESGGTFLLKANKISKPPPAINYHRGPVTTAVFLSLSAARRNSGVLSGL
jgi:hypothetical protein